MSDLRDLYQEVILDHSRHPRNFFAMQSASGHADGVNPLCGDKVSVYVDVQDGVIKDISFQGSGCAISKASASLMTDMVKGKTVVAAQNLFHHFHNLVTGEPAEINLDELEKLSVFSGVKEYPARVKCASLAWHTMRSALNPKDPKKISTE